MSGDGSAPAAPKPFGWPLILGFWFAIAGLLVGYTLLNAGTVPFFGDDAMRMVTATDLYNGQPWQDLSVYRDNTPFGTEMHWSRLIDAPLALLMAAAQPLFGTKAFEAAAAIWPPLLLLPLLVLSVALTRRLVPNAGTMTALALPVVSIVLLVEFLPGRVDHHNVQMLLVLLAALVLVAAADKTWASAIAGLATATSLAIGVETLPLIVVTIAACAILWLVQPLRFRTALAVFGASFALGTLAHFLLATAPAKYLLAACDMLSITYVVAAALGGATLAGCALLLSSRGPIIRGSGLLIGAVAAIAVTLTLYPACLAGPYAVAEPLMQLPGYFDTITEAQSLGATFTDSAASGIVYAAAVLVAVPLTLWCAIAARGEQRVRWLIILAFLVTATLVLLLQIRGARLAAPFAIPAGAWLITAARERYLAGRTVLRAGLLLGSWLLMSGAAYYVLVTAVYALAPATADRIPAPADTSAHTRLERECLHVDTYQRLAALPTGRVMAPFRLGPHILLYTPQSIVSAGFHRNIDGTKDAVVFFSGDEAAAKTIADTRGIDYVATCPGIADRQIIGSSAQPWSWLEPLSEPTEPLQIYRIVR